MVSAALAEYVVIFVYEWTHFLIHTAYRPRSRDYRSVWRNHRLHHFKNERFWHGITQNLSDRVLGTLPDHRDVPKSKTARTWTRRAEPRRALDPGAARRGDARRRPARRARTARALPGLEIGALIEGSFEADVSSPSSRDTATSGWDLNHLDGEMIAIDGRLPGRAQGDVSEVAQRSALRCASSPSARRSIDLEGSLDPEGLLAEIDRRIPADTPSCALRVDGRFELVRERRCRGRSRPTGRSPRSSRSSRFRAAGLDGTVVGFRFPEYAEGIEVAAGTSISSARTGNAAATCSTAGPRRRTCGLDPSGDLHVELPLRESTWPIRMPRRAPTPRSTGWSTAASRGEPGFEPANLPLPGRAL